MSLCNYITNQPESYDQAAINSTARILMAENNLLDADLLRALFASHAPLYAVDVVCSYANMLERLVQPPAYDLLLIDLSMSGQDFLRDAKHSGLTLPPFILISDTSEETCSIAALKLGASDYLIKRESYLNQLMFRIDLSIAHGRLKCLVEQLRAEVAERKQIEENLSAHQIELEMQNEELRRAKVELEAQRARYFDLYYSAPASYCTVSEKGLILQANIAATILLGISYNALIKRPILQFISREDQVNYYLLCQQILRSRKPLGCELQMVKNDGTPFWVNLMATVHYVDDSQEFRIVLVDITEHKQMQEELRKNEEKFYAIADYAVDFELWFAAYGKLLWVNSAAERFTGYSPAEILALPDFFTMFIATEDRELWFANFQIALHGLQGNNLELRCIHKNGLKLWLDASWQSIFDRNGDPLGVRFSLRDIAERKQSEEKLRRAAIVFNYDLEGNDYYC